MNIYPTLIIGIGGTGKLVCKFLKRNFANRFPKEWINPSTGLPHIISIVLIETEPGKEKEELSLPTLPNIKTITAYVDEETLKAMQTKDFKDRNPEVDNWLFSPLPINEIIGGAAQIRQAGRLAFFRHRTAYAQIQKEITSSINFIKSDEAISQLIQLSKGEIKVPDSTPRCYIVSSLCGGTGSGMFLDIAGIANQYGARVNFIGFLPKMFEAVIDLPESVWQTYSNTYATLKEINHYMSGGRWQVWYNKKRKDGVNVEKKIFNYSYLVEKESHDLDLIDRLHVSPLVGNFLFWIINELEHPLHASNVNIKRFMEVESSNWCNALGISSISFPLEEIRGIMVNWGVRDLIEKNLSVDFSQKELTDKIQNRDTGYIYTDFYYKNWEYALLRKHEYSAISADSLLKRRGSLENKVKEEKNRLKREYNDDIGKIKDQYEEYQKKIEERLLKIMDDILVHKGPIYFSNFIERFQTELHRIKTVLENDKQSLSANISQLNETVDKRIKLLGQISRKSWYQKIGWARNKKTHIENILRTIIGLFDVSLESEKHSYSLKIISKLEDLIQSKLEEHSRLINKLNTIRTNKEGDENKVWRILTFGTDAQIKVKSNRKDIRNFYNNYLEKGLSNLAADLRKRLIAWINLPNEEILKEIESTLKKQIDNSGFNKMTILDAMEDDMETLGNEVENCIISKSSPFIRHTAREPHEDRFIISGFDSNEIKKLPKFPSDITYIKSHLESKKRNLIFIRLASNFSISDMAEYDFSDKYAKAYEDSLKNNHKWIHIQKEALGFEDPLGLSIGMEELSLIRTCQDVGIIYQDKAYNYKHKKNGKEVVIGQGLENTIRKLQEDPKYAKLLKEKLTDFLNNKTKDWIIEYFKDHHIENFSGYDKFKKNHEKKYTNALSSNAYSLPPHKIPSYILREIENRLAKKK